GAEATRLLREIEERMRPRRRRREGSSSSPRKASGCSAMKRTNLNTISNKYSQYPLFQFKLF
ncbi:hypothetical protein, partial [Niallia taxi]|uniref:hypothetical protein n=1 Tax=Niallia taxi TaxID=2499688 RepID=UPI001C714084